MNVTKITHTLGAEDEAVMFAISVASGAKNRRCLKNILGRILMIDPTHVATAILVLKQKVT